jgi:hypothetical protein
MKRYTLSGLLMVLLVTACQATTKDANEATFVRFAAYADSCHLQTKPAGARMEGIAAFFIGTPYVGATLEGPGPEQLRINLQGVDCLTLVEYVLALDHCVRVDSLTYDAFQKRVTYIRYRNGILDGYPSRLHYSTDWIRNNVAKGVVMRVDMGTHAVATPLALNFMSTHPGLYPALLETPLFVDLIAAQEADLNRDTLYIVPKANVEAVYPLIETGDILAIGTSVKGLDYAHLGLAIKADDGSVHLLHASSSFGRVILTEGSLKSYLMGVSRHTGITVLRTLK